MGEAHSGQREQPVQNPEVRCSSAWFRNGKEAGVEAGVAAAGVARAGSKRNVASEEMWARGKVEGEKIRCKPCRSL